jgi:hypothetical protein
MLIYDGLHYDALAVSFHSNLILCLFYHDKYYLILSGLDSHKKSEFSI